MPQHNVFTVIAEGREIGEFMASSMALEAYINIVDDEIKNELGKEACAIRREKGF